MALAPAMAGDAIARDGDEDGAMIDAPAGAQSWPRPATAWWALFVLALAMMFSQLDRSIFAMVIEMVKRDFALTDLQLSLLLGPAGVFFYLVIGIPMARLVDIHPRNIVLACGIAVWSGMTAICGITQGYASLFLTRMVSGVGGSAHGPGTYSMLADYFPPKKLPRAIAGLQIGYVVGTGGASIVGGALIGYTSGWRPSEIAGLVIHSWQWVLIIVGLPGLIVAALTWALPEPARRGRIHTADSLPFRAVMAEVWTRRRVYFPLMFGLGLSQVEVMGIIDWRMPFFQRTYGWTPAQVGAWSGLTVFIAFPLGLLIGTTMTEWLSKRHRDAPVRATAIMMACCLPFSLLAPLMPTAPLSLIMTGFSGALGMAGAVPQNAAIQTVTPNQMRGQITALYLFSYTVFGALGSFVVALITRFVVGDESKLWLSMMIAVGAILPIAVVAVALAIRPYGREVARLEALSA
ncbi:MFS transporter [Sphingomonas sp. MMS24-J13]|uniref:MFS transporter n=1 Tax=Sphingomonas sp. MMS24-J13 TaxID=3238686 RepID=UPI003850F295